MSSTRETRTRELLTSARRAREKGDKAREKARFARTYTRAYELADKFFFLHGEIKISSDIRRVQGGRVYRREPPAVLAGTRPFTKVVTFLSSAHRKFMVYILYTSHTCKKLKPRIRIGIILQFDCDLMKHLIIRFLIWVFWPTKKTEGLNYSFLGFSYGFFFIIILSSIMFLQREIGIVERISFHTFRNKRRGMSF